MVLFFGIIICFQLCWRWEFIYLLEDLRRYYIDYDTLLMRDNLQILHDILIARDFVFRRVWWEREKLHWYSVNNIIVKLRFFKL